MLAARSASCTPIRTSSTSCTTALAQARPTSSATSRRRSRYYKSAYDIDSTYLPTLVGRADLLFKMQDWDAAGKIYQTILVQHRDGQDEADVVRIYNRLGTFSAGMGERKKALNMFEKALEIDPAIATTLQARHRSAAAAGRLGSGRSRQARPDGEPRTRPREVTICSTRSAASTTSKLHNPQKATAAYLEALEVTPKITSCCRSCSTSTARPSSGRRRSRSWSSWRARDRQGQGPLPGRGRRHRHYELKSIDEAVEFYNQALDEDPDALEGVRAASTRS